MIQPIKVDGLPQLIPEAKTVSVQPYSTHAEYGTPTGSHEEWMTAAGIQPADYAHVEYIVSRESGWRFNAVNPSSGAFGLCQSLPASKMATAGADWQTNPITQLKWCNSYANRYGGWAGAHTAWIRQNWW